MKNIVFLNISVQRLSKIIGFSCVFYDFGSEKQKKLSFLAKKQAPPPGIQPATATPHGTGTENPAS